MDRDTFIEELLAKYDLDELLDIFISHGLTPRDFCDRFMDKISVMQEQELDRYELDSEDITIQD